MVRLAIIDPSIILQANGNPFWAIARAMKNVLPGHKVEVAMDTDKIYWIDDQRYPIPQNLMDWLAKYARWRIMEPITFEVQYGEIKGMDEEFVGT